MKLFARVTKLTNIAGRADYITNPDRQECIVAASPAIDWEPYQEFERANRRSAEPNNEGREVVIALPNEWDRLPKEELSEKVDQLAASAIGKRTDMQWAVHWNKDHTNLHAHIIFSERTREPNPGRWDRDVYLTDDGKVARKKADRARNEDGSFKPPVHRKGDLKGGFTAKDPFYGAKPWVAYMKANVLDTLQGMGVNIEASGPLHQYHEGKGAEAPVIHAKNQLIEANNEVILAAQQHGPVPADVIEKAKRAALQGLASRQIVQFRIVNGQYKIHSQPFAGYSPEIQIGMPLPYEAMKRAAINYFRIAAEFNDPRKPLTQDVQERPERIRAALDAHEKAVEARRAAKEEKDAAEELGRWRWGRKAKIRAATERYDAAKAAENKACEVLAGTLNRFVRYRAEIRYNAWDEIQEAEQAIADARPADMPTREEAEVSRARRQLENYILHHDWRREGRKGFDMLQDALQEVMQERAWRGKYYESFWTPEHVAEQAQEDVYSPISVDAMHWMLSEEDRPVKRWELRDEVLPRDRHHDVELQPDRDEEDIDLD